LEAWIFFPVTYVPDRPLPQVWPLPASVYDRATGQAAFAHALEQMEFAESLGFDGVDVAEHHYAAASLTPNPTVMAGAVSQRIKKARIAMLGSTVPLTNPVRVAEEYAILDNLTGGRLVAGMLRGTPNEFLTYGTNADESRAMYEEGVQLVIRAWTEPEPFGWQGRHYQYRTVSVWPRPLQEPHPPVLVSGNSADAATFAGRTRLMMGLSFMPVHVAAQQTALYRQTAAKAGWEPGSQDMLYRGFIHIAETDEQAAAEVAHTYWKVPEGTPKHAPEVQPSYSAEAAVPDAGGVATAERAAVEANTSKALSAEQFAKMGLQFCGSPDTVFAQIERLRDETGIGIIDFVFQGPSLPHAMLMRSIELFGRHVLPRMHEL
jgi:alkanesulfonate monooxygenase SsuD/methylene tetrahydromethanopterin reductase-like flavin-dependent oxidoreductase (luciferase family)